jgi:hypothetical protein
MTRRIVFYILIIGFYGMINAQFSHQFTRTAQYEYYELAQGMQINNDGIVFRAVGNYGMKAFRYEDGTLEKVGEVEITGSPQGLTIDSAGTLIVASRDHGLSAYTFHDSIFTLKAYQPIDSSRIEGVAVNSDSVVFVACGIDGMNAYVWHGTSFTHSAHINDGGNADHVAVGPDGTIYLANHGDGLRAYHYDTDSLINIGHIDNGGSARHVVVDSNNTIFLANYTDGLRAYRFDGSSFTNVAHRKEPDAELSTDGIGYALALGSDGTIFFANGDDGLRAYRFTGTDFINTAHIDDINSVYRVAVNSDNIVFAEDAWEGLFAYTYTELTVSIKSNQTKTPNIMALAQNYPNPFNPTTHINYQLGTSGFVSLKVFDMTGREVQTLVSETKNAGQHSVTFNGAGLASGMYVYQIRMNNKLYISKKMLLLK